MNETGKERDRKIEKAVSLIKAANETLTTASGLLETLGISLCRPTLTGYYNSSFEVEMQVCQGIERLGVELSEQPPMWQGWPNRDAEWAKIDGVNFYQIKNKE